MRRMAAKLATLVPGAHARVHPALLVLLTAGCIEAAPPTSEETFEIRVCADGPTVEGIDVSKWQGAIDWDAVAGDGIDFAFIRTSHGLGYIDEYYEQNWAEARRVGILRGTYQYFAPSEDVIAQADVLLDRMGPLEPGDLPPVLDVEADDGLGPAAIVEAIHLWSDHVEAALGVKPIIYTAKYFWQDNVGAPEDFLDHSLWVANYGVTCPLIADPWPRWDFWQYTSTGSVAGIAGNVDRDVWNGTIDELDAFTWRPTVGPDQVIGAGTTRPDEDGDGDGDGDDDDEIGGCSAGGGRAGWLFAIAVGLVIRRRPRVR